MIDWFGQVSRRAVRQRLAQWSDWPPVEADVLVVSFPKAGRTWLRVLLPAALALVRGAPPDADLDRWLASDRVRHADRTVFFTHALASRETVETDDLRAFADAWRRTRVLLILRDPRDLVVSYFFQRTKRRRPTQGGRPAPPDVASFIRDPQFGAFRIIEMFNIWHDALRKAPRAMILPYETLHADPACGARQAIRFLFGVEIPAETARHAAEYAAFDHMRTLELSDRFAARKRLWTPDKSDPDSFKTRKGRIGSFVETLDDADIAWLDRLIAARLAPELGYRTPGDPPPGFLRDDGRSFSMRLATWWSRGAPDAIGATGRSAADR